MRKKAVESLPNASSGVGKVLDTVGEVYGIAYKKPVGDFIPQIATAAKKQVKK